MRKPPRTAVSRRAALISAGVLFGVTPPSSLADVATLANTDSYYFRIAPTSPTYTSKGEANRKEPQKTYNPKFVSYLTRLLLNFDRASQAWWQDQTNTPFPSARLLEENPQLRDKMTSDFERLQVSISLGLREYQSPDGINLLFELLRARFGKIKHRGYELCIG